MEQIKEKYGPGLATAGRWAKVLTDEVVKVSPTSSTSIGSASASTSTTTSTTTTTSATCRTRSTSSSSTCDGGRLGSYLVVEGVESLSKGAVHVEPPVADEVLLVEDCSVGTQERVGDQVAVDVTQGTEVERL